MSQSIQNLDHKIQQLQSRRELLKAKERTAARRKLDREAREIGLWLMKNKPQIIARVRELMSQQCETAGNSESRRDVTPPMHQTMEQTT